MADTTTIDHTDPRISVILATGTRAEAMDFLAEAIRDGAWGDVRDFAEAAEVFGTPALRDLAARALPTDTEAPDLG